MTERQYDTKQQVYAALIEVLQRTAEKKAFLEQSANQHTANPEAEEQPVREMDVLNLPPRRTVHDGSAQKWKWRWNGALARLVLVCIFVILLTAAVYLVMEANWEQSSQGLSLLLQGFYPPEAGYFY